MRRGLLFKILSITLLVSLAFGFVASYSYAQDPLKKLCRGALNATTAILEIPKNIRDAGKEGGVGMALTYGAVKGVFWFVGRTLVGLYEIVTFPIPIPRYYEPILLDPEYFFGKPEPEKEFEAFKELE